MKELLGKHKFLSTYLSYVEETESPRLFHCWSALSGISAALGRRVWFPFGIENIYPNMFVVLVGPSGAKKSTALKMMRRILETSTGVRFAPDDTAGHRQGFINAIIAADVDEQSDLEAGLMEALSVGNVAAIDNVQIDIRDPHSIYVCQSEFNTFIGEKSTQMMTFLIKMFDGDDYEYQIKKEQQVLKNAMVNILGATTPSQIALSMPPEAVGQGFTSRLVFVYAAEKYKRIPRPSRLSAELEGELKAVYSHVFNNLNGAMLETPEAAKYLDSLYMKELKIKDPRFVHYAERRHTHLIKLTMAVAASNCKQLIEIDDVVLADELLELTEKSMPDALGEYGLSKLSAAKQKLLEFIRSSTDAIPIETIFSAMSKDMRQNEIVESLNDLRNSGQISQVKLGVDQRTAFIARVMNARLAKEELSKMI